MLRYLKNNSQLILFFFTGVINYLITLVIYVSMLYYFNFKISLIISIIAGIIFWSFLNIKIVFNKSVNYKRLILISIYYIIYSYISIQLAEYYIIDLGVFEWIGSTVVLVTLFIPHFFISRLIINL